MDQHLSFYPQYQPSFDADQSKIDEFSLDSLNTPDINPDFFTDSPNLFPKVGSSLIGSTSSVSAGKMAIKTDDDYMVFDLGMNNQTSNYSPYSEDTKQQQHHHQLDSAAININSPEMMMPVSPNKVCPQLDGYDLLDQQQQQQQFTQMSDYETMVNFDYHQSSPSTSNSRSSSISAGSDTYLSEYILSDPAAHLMTGSVDPSLCRVPHSPAGSISSFSSDASSNKKYIQLETVHQPQIVIKQEPVDSLYPTVVEDLYEYNQLVQQQPQQQQQAPVSSYSTINTSDLSNYYYTNALPSTVSSAIMQQQQQQQTVVMPTPTISTPTVSGRKRNAGTAFASTSTSSSSSSSTSHHHNHQSTSTSATGGSKKPRMTKREKQKLMEGDISKYENENRELRNSIDLLERQIQFCKRFLSENVAPVIQRQQMQSNSHFGPNQSQLVAIALESQ